jgi:hypothetical protein
MQFDDIVDRYINRNSDVLNIPKNSLCPDLFSFNEGTPPVLLETVRLHILNDIERIAPYIKINSYYLTGECLIPSSEPSRTCDLTMCIEFASYNDDVTSHMRAFHLLKKLNARYIDRTQHKIYYHMYSEPVSIHDLRSAYDVLRNKWMKVPEIDDEDFDTDN